MTKKNLIFLWTLFSEGFRNKLIKHHADWTSSSFPSLHSDKPQKLGLSTQELELPLRRCFVSPFLLCSVISFHLAALGHWMHLERWSFEPEQDITSTPCPLTNNCSPHQKLDSSDLTWMSLQCQRNVSFMKLSWFQILRCFWRKMSKFQLFRLSKLLTCRVLCETGQKTETKNGSWLYFSPCPFLHQPESNGQTSRPWAFLLGLGKRKKKTTKNRNRWGFPE